MVLVELCEDTELELELVLPDEAELDDVTEELEDEDVEATPVVVLDWDELVLVVDDLLPDSAKYPPTITTRINTPTTPRA